ncbi:carbohydrate ABC transporter permease [Rhizobium sp. BK251]|uniref:carbohydrate ABC transporter permease n=1 Tax=Rhizobium sp. BK251 TaxID=2512125 RepID=UPI00104A2772|nr:carbohydrate ABC transporter permease [Rhizobium sp. BK251]TCL73501.1 carbohydrate ABC transporter membrane protein 2 (CUT1 family) [Rhizobium sp. BK251]
MTLPDRLFRLIAWGATLALAIAVFVPFVIGVLAAMLAPSDVMSQDMRFWPLFPSNFMRVFTETSIGHYFLNSILIATATMVGTMVTSILAAYAFTRMEFPGRTVLFWAVLATLTVPELICIIPNYLLMAKLKLVPSIWAAIIPQLASGFTTFFLRQHFLGVPVMYDEAARLDGARHFRILVDILVPMTWPVIASMALFSFIAQWNSYLWPLIVLRGDSQTVQIALAGLQATVREQPFIDWPLILSASCVVLLPSIFMFFLAERQLVRGAGLGGLK